MTVDVLDKGKVKLIDHMGNDSRIVESARVSYGKGTKTLREDEKLINYLYKNKHTSPFEQVVFTFYIKLPIFIARQLVRHRTARLNEISGRYSIISDEFYIPHQKVVCSQSTNNKQGRGEPLSTPDAELVKNTIEKTSKECYEQYKFLLNLGTSREIARMVLPLNIYTEIYWQMDLNNLFKFLELRLDSHAQYEIRQYAQAILSIIKEIVPMATKSFLKDRTIE